MSDRYSSYRSLKFDWPAPRVLRVTINRPERNNSLDANGHRELTDVWRDIDADPDVSAVILCGAGKTFSVGGDFELVEAMINEFDAKCRAWREARDLVYNVINCSKPIVSAVQGAAAGAGLAAALLSDISIVAKTAKLVDGHTRLGCAAGDHGAIIWPLLCGMAKSKYYLLLCEPISGEKAEEIGLVSMTVDEAELQDTAVRIATRLAKGSPTAIRWTKYAMNNWLRMAGPTFDASTALEILGFSGPDVREGLASHLEKREPNFGQDTPV